VSLPEYPLPGKYPKIFRLHSLLQEPLVFDLTGAIRSNYVAGSPVSAFLGFLGYYC
jgi:hypothetical protein